MKAILVTVGVLAAAAATAIILGTAKPKPQSKTEDKKNLEVLKKNLGAAELSEPARQQLYDRLTGRLTACLAEQKKQQEAAATQPTTAPAGDAAATGKKQDDKAAADVKARALLVSWAEKSCLLLTPSCWELDFGPRRTLTILCQGRLDHKRTDWNLVVEVRATAAEDWPRLQTLHDSLRAGRDDFLLVCDAADYREDAAAKTAVFTVDLSAVKRQATLHAPNPLKGMSF